MKAADPWRRIAFIGSHTSALPHEVLGHEFVDLVLPGEGVYALHNLLAGDLEHDLPRTRGMGFRPVDGGGRRSIVLNAPERTVPRDRMDHDLPGYAWDLLPYDRTPLDLYRSHFWHANFDRARRTPFRRDVHRARSSASICSM